MKPRAFSLIAALSLIAAFASEAGSIADFAQHSLAVDVGQIKFGSILDDHFQRCQEQDFFEDFGPATNLPARLTWYENELSASYAKRFTGRTLVFGFTNGQLAAIEFKLHSIVSGSTNAEKFQALRQQLMAVQNDLTQSNPEHKLNFSDGHDRVFYAALCSPLPESLMLSSIRIEPVDPPPKSSR